jgi:hypothetical protein
MIISYDELAKRKTALKVHIDALNRKQLRPTKAILEDMINLRYAELESAMNLQIRNEKLRRQVTRLVGMIVTVRDTVGGFMK